MESREVPVDVLPPVGRNTDVRLPEEAQDRPPFDGLNTFYHPASGVVILAIDWLIFGTDLVTGFLALPIMCVVGFIATFAFVMAIQQKWGRDNSRKAMGKAFLGAFLVGLPFPITGTLLGAAILVMSGLPHHPVDAVKKLITQATPK